ncbi:MAG: Rossmann-like domain-containing protein [Promethearchaeota archaeon]|jgi:uncharacterized protein (DUF4213/DUF364 family)
MILEQTVDLIHETYDILKVTPPKVTKVVIGLGYTGVEVISNNHERFLGLTSTLPSVINITDCSKIEFAGNLTSKSVRELMEWSFNPPSIKKIIGLATINGISQHLLKIRNNYTRVNGELVKYLKINKVTAVTVIGFMKPLIRKLKKYTDSITIIEDVILNSEEFQKFTFKKNIEELKGKEFSPNILFCTGTVIINNTIERILEVFRRRAQKIIIIGPSASILPDILFKNGVDVVGGMSVHDIESTLRVLQEGGGTKLFKLYGKKYNLIKKKPINELYSSSNNLN